MSEQRFDIVDAAEDAAKVGYSFGVFAFKAFYRVSGIEALIQSYNDYEISKLSQTIENFQYEQDKLNVNQRKEFYEDLKYNEQNLAYLHSLFNKSREATFLVHMKILSKLSSSLVENKTLNYHESTLLSNIDILNEDDFIKFHCVLKAFFDKEGEDIDTTIMKEHKITYVVSSYTDQFIFDKLIRVGLILDSSDIDGGLFPEDISHLQDHTFYIHEFTREIYKFMNEIIKESE